MPDVRFLQIHTLTTYPAALLNRDDAGLAKRLPFGGTTRARISSQCQKRHWRMASDQWALCRIPDLSDRDFGIRSRRIFSDRIASPLISEGFDASNVIEVVSALRERLFPKQDDGTTAEGDGDSGSGRRRTRQKADDQLVSLRFDQAFLLGRAEIEYLTDLCRRVLAGNDELKQALFEKPKKKSSLTPFQRDLRADLTDNLKEIAKGTIVPRSVEAALFGRMVTSDLVSNPDAAIHVAHAFTVHEIERELDFMTAVDDLKDASEGDDAGAAGMFDMELASGLYYGYVVVDTPLLVKNLSKDRAIAGKVVEHLVHLIAQVSPGAKKGSTAPYAWAELVLVEAGARQPRTLANAFRTAIPLRRNSGALLETAVAKMEDHVSKLDGGYGRHEARRVLNLSDTKLASAAPLDLDALAEWSGHAVCAGVAQ
jgi:CRISPR system Cascade subunit CasC